MKEFFVISFVARDKLVADERKFRDMEEALRKARADVEHFKKQLAEAHRVAMSQASPPPPYPGGVGGLLAVAAATTTSNSPGISPNPHSLGQQQQQSVSPTPLSAMNRQPPAVSSSQYPVYSTYGGASNISLANNSASLVNSMSGGYLHNQSGNNIYNSSGGGYNSGTNTMPRTVVTTGGGSVITSRATQGNPVVRSVPGHGAGIVGNSLTGGGASENSTGQSSKYHQQNYSNSGT